MPRFFFATGLAGALGLEATFGFTTTGFAATGFAGAGAGATSFETASARRTRVPG